MTAFLHTKIQLPPLQSGYVARERIQTQISTNTNARLLLVSAPAGSGKSTALIQWARRLRKPGRYIAWYALDERDNDPKRFATYLLEAFRRQNAIGSSLPDRDEQITLQDAVDHILNAVDASDAPAVLILDDYHLITEPRIHNAIGHMIDHLPPGVQLAIGTRADPPLQLARLRVRGDMAEIRMRDLRFTPDEIRAWLNMSSGQSPSSADIQALDSATEGWAAALALILMNQTGTGLSSLTQQLACYSQSRRHIFDYFASEILAQQPERIRDFLLDTCILNRLEPAVCQAVTNRSDAALLLNQIARRSLFVIPLSDTEPVYRYHHLFSDFLRQYLEMNDPARYRQQHLEGANWYASHGDVVEAVHHALRASDYHYAADLITNHAWELLTARGEIMTVIRWLTHFSDEQIRQFPRLCLYFSRALYLVGDAEQSQQYVQMAIDVLADEPQPALQAIASGYQATLAAYRGDVVTGHHWINRADELRDYVSGVDRVRIANTDAFLHYLTDSISVARETYDRALSLADDIGHDFLALDAHFYLAQIDLLAGELQAVQNRCETLLAQYARPIAPLSAIMLPLARVHYQRNQIVQAEATLRNAIRLADRANLPDILWLAYMNLANSLSAAEIDEATAMLTQARHIADDFRSPVIASIIEAAEAQLMLRTGQIDNASAWADRFQANQPHHQHYETLTAGRVHLAQGQYDDAMNRFNHLITDAEINGRTWYVMAGKAHLALVYHATGDTAAAYSTLNPALNAAQPHRIIRLFLDAGQPMINLLGEIIRQNSDAHYAAHLLDVADDDSRVQHPADVLTEREIEVLQHVATGASNQQIADRLFISVGTVKSHIHHIMNKLDAQNRTEAVSTAQSLHILLD